MDDNSITLTQYQYDAVTSFLYNLGQYSFDPNSDDGYREAMDKFLKKGDYTYNATYAAFMTYVNKNRRQREIDLFVKGVYF